MKKRKITRLDLLMRIHQRFRHLQLRTYFANKPYGQKTSLLDVHLLLELDTDAAVGQSELTAAVGVHKVNASRALQGLAGRGLVRSRVNPNDSRSKGFSLTTKGVAFVRQLDFGAGVLMQQFCWFMSPSQQQRLGELWTALCDGLGAPPVRIRPGIHPLLVPGRRHSRGFGLLGTTAFGVEGLSSLEWHTLSLIDDGRCSSPTGLASILKLNSATALGVERCLLKEGLLCSQPDPVDRRGVVLEVSPAGKKLLEKTRARAVAQLDAATKEFSLSDLEDFLELIHRHGADLSNGESIVLGKGYEIGIVRSESERSEVRSFLLHELVRSQMTDHAEEVVCHRANTVVALRYDQTDIMAMVEIADHGARLVYGVVGQDCPLERVRECLDLVKHLCMQQWGATPELRIEGASALVRDAWFSSSEGRAGGGSKARSVSR